MFHGWDAPDTTPTFTPCALTPASRAGLVRDAHPDLTPYPSESFAALACPCMDSTLDPAELYR